MGLVVWCVGDEGQCVPLRLDAIRLSGALTIPHLEAVSELIRLAVTHRLVLTTSQQLFNPPREPCATNESDNIATNSNIDTSNNDNISNSVVDNNNNNNDNDINNNNKDDIDRNDDNNSSSNCSSRSSSDHEISLKVKSEVTTERHWCSKSQEKRLQRLREVWARNTRKLSTGSSSYCVFEDQK